MTTFLRKVRSTLLSRIGATAVQMGAMLMFARFLSTDAFGSFVLYLGVVSIASVVTDFGLANAVTKRVSAGSNPEQILGTAIVVKVITITSVVPAVYLSQNVLNQYFNEELALLLIPGLAGYHVGKLSIRFLHGEQKVALGERLDLLRRVLFSILGIVGVIAGFGVVAPVWAYVLSWAIVAVAGFTAISASIGQPSVDIATSLFAFGKYDFIASSIGAPLYSWTDTLLIGVFLSPTAVGAYELAWQISSGALLMGKSISLVLFPAVSDWASNDDIGRIQNLLPDAVVGSLSLVAPVIIGTAIIGESILALVQPEYVVAAAAFFVLTLCRGFQAVNSIAVRSLYGFDAPQYPAYAAAVFIVINTALNLILIPRLGLLGAAVATLTAFIINTVINWRVLWNQLQFSMPIRELVAIGVASVLMGTVLLTVFEFWKPKVAGRVVGGVIIGGVVYMLLLLGNSRVRQTFHTTVKDYLPC